MTKWISKLECKEEDKAKIKDWIDELLYPALEKVFDLEDEQIV